MLKTLVGALVVLAALAVFAAPRAASVVERGASVVASWQQASHADFAKARAARCAQSGRVWLSIPSSVFAGECVK